MILSCFAESRPGQLELIKRKINSPVDLQILQGNLEGVCRSNEAQKRLGDATRPQTLEQIHSKMATEELNLLSEWLLSKEVQPVIKSKG